MIESDLQHWLTKNHLHGYLDAFKAHDIVFEDLPELTEVDLREMGLKTGPRKQFLRCISRSNAEFRRKPSHATIEPGGESRQLTVLFYDLVNSTVFIRTFGGEIAQEIEINFHRKCEAIVAKYGGIKSKEQGDGGFCLFGYPMAHEDAAHRAVHAALEIIDAAKDVTRNLSIQWQVRVRVGIATGRVVAQSTDDLGHVMVTGDAANLAPRLKDEVPPNSVAISPRTRRHLGEAFKMAKLGARTLKGFEDRRIEVFQVLDHRPGLTRFEASHSGTLGRMIGREAELALVAQRWNTAREGEGQVVLLTGRAGIGKSRLARTVIDHTGLEPGLVQHFQCSAIHRSTPLYPFVERIKRVADLERQDSMKARSKKLRIYLADKFKDPETVFALFAPLLSIKDSRETVLLQLSAEEQKEATVKALIDEIVQASGNGASVIWIEDVHWIDATSHELLVQLIRRVETLRTLIVLTARDTSPISEFLIQWRSRNFTEIGLGMMNKKESRQFVTGLLGQTKIHSTQIDRIVSKAGGLPLWIEELTKMVRDWEVDSDQRPTSSEHGFEAMLPTPDTLEDFLMERLDRLSLPVKQLAQFASALGSEFTYGLLKDMSENASAIYDLEDALEELVATGHLVRDGPTPNSVYWFRHALIQDAAYDSMLRRDKQILHAQIAQILEVDYKSAASFRPEIIAHHFSNADPAKHTFQAIFYWVQAGDLAQSHFSMQEAINHYERGLQLVDGLAEGLRDTRESAEKADTLELSLRIGAARAISSAKGQSGQGIEENYRRALELATDLEVPKEQFHAHLALAENYYVGGKLSEGRMEKRRSPLPKGLTMRMSCFTETV